MLKKAYKPRITKKKRYKKDTKNLNNRIEFKISNLQDESDIP